MLRFACGIPQDLLSAFLTERSANWSDTKANEIHKRKTYTTVLKLKRPGADGRCKPPVANCVALVRGGVPRAEGAALSSRG